jgi:AcrR family transcriptional regulator
MKNRRRSPEIRDLLITSACEQFTTKGYSATTMKDISDHAGIVPSVLYKHFPFKSELLREAVLHPFLRFLDAFAADWQELAPRPGGGRKLILDFISDLYEDLLEHRGALITLVAAQHELEEDINAQVVRALRRMFIELREIGELEAASRGRFPANDIELTIRIIVAMVAGSTVFEDLLLPPRSSVDREQLFTHMADLMTWGLRREPPPPPSGSAAVPAGGDAGQGNGPRRAGAPSVIQ